MRRRAEGGGGEGNEEEEVKRREQKRGEYKRKTPESIILDDGNGVMKGVGKWNYLLKNESYLSSYLRTTLTLTLLHLPTPPSSDLDPDLIAPPHTSLQ